MMAQVVHPDCPNRQSRAASECQCCPVGRSGHRIVATDNFLYSLGGFNPAIGGGLDPLDDTPEPYGERGHPCLFKELWKFNLSTQKWHLIDDFRSVPPTIASHTIALLGRWLFLFGGTAIPFGDTPSSSLYRYDLQSPPQHTLRPHSSSSSPRSPPACDDSPETNDDAPGSTRSMRWTLIDVEGDIPDERYGHSMTLAYPDLYVIGGTSGFIYNSDVFHLDMSQPTGRWTKLSSDGDPNQPVGRYRHETAFDGEKLFVFGGGTDRDAFSLKHIHTFNVKTRWWKTLKSYPDAEFGFPEPRKCHSCCQYKNDVFLVGGVGSSPVNRVGGATAFSDVWRFCLQSGSWSKIPLTLPQPLYFHSAGLIPSQGLLYVFGGVTQEGQAGAVRTSQVLRGRVAVGDLLELAWTVFVSSLDLRDLRHSKPLDLDDLGIPQCLQSRLLK